MENIELNFEVCKGFTRELALADVKKFKPDSVVGANCTQAWIKAGKPILGSDRFRKFCFDQLQRKTRLEPGYGCYIIAERGSRDCRIAPCKIIKNKDRKGARKYKRVHQISEVFLRKNKAGEYEVESVGMPINMYFDTYAEALDTVKQLTSQLHKNYIIQSIKVAPNSTEAFSVYTPSQNAKEGTFIAFGINKSETYRYAE